MSRQANEIWHLSLKTDLLQPKNCTAKWLECVLSLLIYRRWEQDRKGRELGDKGKVGEQGTGSERFLPPCHPLLPVLCMVVSLVIGDPSKVSHNYYCYTGKVFKYWSIDRKLTW